MWAGIQLDEVARRSLAVVGFVVLAGWGVPFAGAEPVPDFSVSDVNPNSVRGGQEVSPRDYLLQVSVYYFGAAG